MTLGWHHPLLHHHWGLAVCTAGGCARRSQTIVLRHPCQLGRRCCGRPGGVFGLWVGGVADSLHLGYPSLRGRECPSCTLLPPHSPGFTPPSTWCIRQGHWEVLPANCAGHATRGCVPLCGVPDRQLPRLTSLNCWLAPRNGLTSLCARGGRVVLLGIAVGGSRGEARVGLPDLRVCHVRIPQQDQGALRASMSQPINSTSCGWGVWVFRQLARATCPLPFARR